MKVTIDEAMCAATGGCAQICPEVFVVRTDGYLHLLTEFPAPKLHDKVRTAADLCPTAAILLDEDAQPPTPQPRRPAAGRGAQPSA